LFVMDFISSNPILLHTVRILVNGIIPTVSVIVIGAALVGIKINIKQFLLLCLAGAANFALLIAIKPPTGINVVILVGGMALASYFIFKLDALTAITIAVMGEFVESLIETPLLDLYLWLAGIDKAAIQTGISLGARYSILLMIGASALIIHTILRHYNLNLKSLLNRKNVYSEIDQQWFLRKLLPNVMLLLIPVITLICLNDALEIFVDMGTLSQHWNVFNTIDIFLVFILSGISIYAVINIFKLLEADFGYKVTSQHLRCLEDMVGSIRKQRHDFNHHLHTVYGLLEIDEFDRAKAYINRTVEIVAAQNDLLKTDNPFVSSVLYTKIAMAEVNKIEVRVSIAGSLLDLPVSNHELTSVLGNLFDNAIAAVENNELTDKVINVNIERSSESLVVTVSNPGHIPKEIASRLFEPNFSTKGSSGLGLPISREIVERHGGTLNMSVNENNVNFRGSIPLPA